MKNPRQIPFTLSVIIAIVAFIATCGGLFLPNLYNDKNTFITMWKANDLVTLVLVVPMLLITLQKAKKGSERYFLIWMGILAYMAYNYAFYLFGAAFNSFFLLYAAVFSLSIYALVLGLSQFDSKGMTNRFSNKTPVKWISLFLLLISLPLAFVEVSECIKYLTTSKVPDAPSLVFALDLSIVIPNTALAAILLWRQHDWGYVLASIMLIKAFTYGVVLCVATTLVALNPLGVWDPLMPFYVFIATGGFICGFALLRNIKSYS